MDHDVVIIGGSFTGHAAAAGVMAGGSAHRSLIFSADLTPAA